MNDLWDSKVKPLQDLFLRAQLVLVQLEESINMSTNIREIVFGSPSKWSLK